jgi:hypothetical protein
MPMPPWMMPVLLLDSVPLSILIAAVIPEIVPEFET